MRLVMTLLVSDEADLVEPLLDFHLDQGVDFFVVTANRASEDVVEKVERYAERGVARLMHDDDTAFRQPEWVTSMARMAAEEHGADWVINADADEFYWAEAATLKEVLAAVPAEYGALDVPMCHFVPRPEEDGFFADRLTVRELWSLKPSNKAVFAKAVHRGVADVEVSIGNHRVWGTGLDLLPGWRPITGLHFPFRSYWQLEQRVQRDLRAGPSYAHGRYARRLELYRSGRLREAYDEKVLDDREVEEGVREGRLVVDERLKRFFEARSGAGDTAPAGCDPARLDELRLEARRAVVDWERHPLHFEAEALRRRLARVEGRREAAYRRQKKAQRRKNQAKAELEDLRSTWYVRAGSLVASVASSARKLPSRRR